MSIRIRAWRQGHKHHPGAGNEFEVHLRVRLANGGIRQERRKFVGTRSEAKFWAEARCHELVRGTATAKVAKAPTLAEFVGRFMENYVVANRHKPSTVVSTKKLLRVYLVPRLGGVALDAITQEHVQRLKADLGHLAPKTVNNALACLSRVLRVAVEWGVLTQMPVTVKLLRVPKSPANFYDFPDFERLVEAAGRIGWRPLALVLLGGDAGLRCGEILALEWSDLDFRRGVLTVGRSEWRGHVTEPKSGRARSSKMTERLCTLLRDNRHLGTRVLLRDDGKPATRATVSSWMRAAQRRAGLKLTGATHVLRHSFCSRLAMLGAPARAIQELAGHADLSTTQRYMHLTPAAKDQAVLMLDRAVEAERTGKAKAEP